MTHYKEIGLSNTKEMFKKAMAGGYAVVKGAALLNMIFPR